MSQSTHPILRHWQKIWSPIDPWLFYGILAIYIMSLFLLYSADGQTLRQLENKTLHTIIGFGLLWLVARTRPQVLSNFALPLYLISLAMLIAVHFFGVTVNGSQRWLNLGFIRPQPSEIMKIALPMMVAWYLQKHEHQLDWKRYLIAAVLVIMPGFLILKQPDLGTTILIMSSGFFVIFFAGLPWKVLLVGSVSLIAALPLIWQYGMHAYQKTRVLTLLDPTKDPLGAGYHILQSMTAIGSGGVWGKGWLYGTQTHLDYIPEATTDFIFAVYSEEFGFIGNLLLLAVYTLVLTRGILIAARARTLYNRTLAGALTLIIFCYVFVNIGMVSGILPVVGVPLPLISYGGTATLSIMVIIGILMSISHQNRQS